MCTQKNLPCGVEVIAMAALKNEKYFYSALLGRYVGEVSVDWRKTDWGVKNLQDGVLQTWQPCMGRANLKGACAGVEQQQEWALIDAALFGEDTSAVRVKERQLRRSAKQVFRAWENLLALQRDLFWSHERAPRKLHRIRMWFVLEELEMVEHLRQARRTCIEPADVMEYVAARICAVDHAMEAYGLYGFCECPPASKWHCRFIVNHCSAPHGLVLGYKPGIGRGDAEAAAMPAPDAGADCTEMAQLERMVEPEVPVCDAKAVKPHHVVHEMVHCFNSTIHRVKSIREVVKDEDMMSICTESEANTVLAYGRDWHRRHSRDWHTGVGAMKVSMVKAGVTGQTCWNMDKVKIHPPDINLRNIHDLMVVGGLYPPTDTPPPLNIDRIAGRRSTR
jgi:hypothetical protein